MAEHPRVVELPGLTRDSAVEQANKMLAVLAGVSSGRRFQDREKSRHALLDTLDWLWDVITEPVLNALRCTGPAQDGEPRTRVWWCPTGP